MSQSVLRESQGSSPRQSSQRMQDAQEHRATDEAVELGPADQGQEDRDRAAVFLAGGEQEEQRSSLEQQQIVVIDHPRDRRGLRKRRQRDDEQPPLERGLQRDQAAEQNERQSAGRKGQIDRAQYCDVVGQQAHEQIVERRMGQIIDQSAALSAFQHHDAIGAIVGKERRRLMQGTDEGIMRQLVEGRRKLHPTHDMEADRDEPGKTEDGEQRHDRIFEGFGQARTRCDRGHGQIGQVRSASFSAPRRVSFRLRAIVMIHASIFAPRVPANPTAGLSTRSENA